MDNQEKPTTSLILDQDEVVALLAAIGDSTEKCEFFTTAPEEQIASYLTHLNLEPEQLSEHINNLRTSAQNLLSHYAPLVQELQEAYSELNSIEQAYEQGKIVGLDKKPLN